MIKFEVGLGFFTGLAAGYALGRVLEARAQGVPLDVAFSNVADPVIEAAQKAREIAQEQMQGCGC